MLNYDHSSKQPEDISHGSWKQISTQKSNSVSFDRLGKYCAVHVDFGTIDLWDTSATPVPMSSLKYSFLGDGFVCNNINWSHNAHYVVCTFFYKNSSKESVTNDRCILVYEVATLQLIRHFKVPFTVVTTCFLPFNDDNCLLLGTAEVEQFFLLDMLSNTLRPLLIHDNSPTASEMDPSISDLSVSVGGEASMIFLSNALHNSCDTTEHNPKLSDFWREVLSQSANSASTLSGVAQSMVRASSSAALVADFHCADVTSEASCALYLVLNGATGAASKLCKLSLLQSTFANEGSLSLRLVNWVRLWGFGSRVSAITPNSSGSLLVLEASLTLAVQVFSTNLSQSEGSEGLVAFHSAPLHGQAYRSASSQQNTRQQAFSHVKADQMLDCKGVGFVRHNSKGSAKTSSDEWLVVAVQASPADVAITNKLVFCALDDAWVSESAPDTHQQGSYSLPLPRSGVLQFSAKPTCDSDGFGASSINSLLTPPALLMCVDRTHRLFSQSWHLASSDFPGPMYPIGYQLVKQCVTYIEAEAELDRVVSSPSALHSCSDSPSSYGQSSTSLLLGIAERPRQASAVDRSVYLSRLPFSLRDTVHDLRDKAVAGTGSRSVGCKRKRMVRGKMTIETSTASGIGSTVDNSVVDEDTLDVVVGAGTGDRSAGRLGGGESSGSDSGEEDDEARARVPQLTSHLFALPTSSYFATSGSSSSFSTSMLQDVLTVPNKIHTGDYFAKLQRDREMGAALVALTQDGGHVRQSLLRLQTEAVERAVAHEEAKERARLRSKEKSEEKRHKQLEEQRQMLLANTLREQALAEERRKAEQQQYLQQQQLEQHIKEQHAVLAGEVHQEEVSNVAFALARHLRERQLSSEIKNEPKHTIVELPTETETEEGLC